MNRTIRFLLLQAVVFTFFEQSLSADDDAAKAQKLIDRAIKAMGGAKALAKTRHTIIEDEGTYYGMGDGVPYKGRYVYVFGNPGRFRMEILGQFLSVTDGDKAWMSVMGMTTDLNGKALEVAQQAWLVAYAMSLIPVQKPNMEFKLSLAKPETIEDEECEGVKIDHKNMPTLTIMLSKKTGLIKKTIFVNAAPELGFKEVTEENVFHEYKKFEGFFSPTKMTMYRDGKKFVESNVKKASYPDKIDEIEFKKP